MIWTFKSPYCVSISVAEAYSSKNKTPVVQKVHNAYIHWINLYPVDSATRFPNSYPLDGDLSIE